MVTLWEWELLGAAEIRLCNVIKRVFNWLSNSDARGLAAAAGRPICRKPVGRKASIDAVESFRSASTQPCPRRLPSE